MVTFDPPQVDTRFIAELVLVRRAVQHLEYLPSYVKDGAPDVYVFTISTLRVSQCSSNHSLAARPLTVSPS